MIEISVLQYYSAVSDETRINCQNILKIKYFKMYILLLLFWFRLSEHDSTVKLRSQSRWEEGGEELCVVCRHSLWKYFIYFMMAFDKSRNMSHYTIQYNNTKYICDCSFSCFLLACHYGKLHVNSTSEGQALYTQKHYWIKIPRSQVTGVHVRSLFTVAKTKFKKVKLFEQPTT